MRILYVTSGFPYPLTSGYLRHYHFIRNLSPHHQITLLSVVGSSFQAAHKAAMAPFTERIFTFVSANKAGSFQQKALRRMRLLLQGTRGDVAVQQMRAALNRLTRGEHFDVLLFSGKDAYRALAALSDIPIVADMCDATSIRIRGSMRYASPPRLLLLLLDFWQMRHVESALMSQSAHVLFASARDREALLGSSVNQVTVIPNGVDLEFWKRASCERGVYTIIFTGAMNYPPNTDAARYLIAEILPSVQESVPGAQLLIVGRDPPPSIHRAGRHPGVTVTGFVDDMRSYLERATVFAAPLRFGAGIQNKMLEAMAMEVPVVASPLAADGLRTENGQPPPVMVAMGRQQFADMLVQQLQERSNHPAPDTQARQYIQEHFRWSSSAEKLEQVLQAAAKR